MPRMSLEYFESLTKVVHDVNSPRVSIPRAGCERRSCSLLWRLPRPNKSSSTQAPPTDADCRSILCESCRRLDCQGSEMGPESLQGRPECLRCSRTRGSKALAPRRRLLDDDTGRRAQRSDGDNDRARGGSFVVYDMLPHGLQFMRPVTAVQG